MKAKFSLYVTAIVLVAVLTVGVGCTKAPNDAQLTSDIQTKLASDSGLQGKQLGVKAEGGTVTLTGTVDNDAQRDAAARYASSEPGVKQIINNLQVAPAPPAETAQAAPPIEETKPSPAPASKPRRREPRVRSLPSSSNDSGSTAPVAAMAPPAATAVVPSTPPPPPPPKRVTIPSGTTLAVRLVDAIDSEVSQQGQTFHATLGKSVV